MTTNQLSIVINKLIDYRWAVVLSMITTSSAVLMLLIGTIIDYPLCAHQKEINTKVFASNYFLATGTFMFAYGGHAAFPTIIHDMRKPYHFSRSVILAFSSKAYYITAT